MYPQVRAIVATSTALPTRRISLVYTINCEVVLMSQAVCMSALPTLNFCLPQLIVCQRSVRVAPKQCVQVGQLSVDVLPGRARLTTDPKLIGSSCSATIGMARLACRITIAAFVFPANHTVGLEPKMGSAQTPSGFVYGVGGLLPPHLGGLLQ